MKEFKSKIQELYQPRINEQTVAQFSQLIAFIDKAISASFKESGDERAQSLISNLLNIRDYLSTNVRENALRQHLLNEATKIISELENPPEEVKKKESPEQISLNQEKTSVKDL